jgi:DtxR family transcriptional regulator, Mn-dependent transcriptional regulator
MVFGMPKPEPRTGQGRGARLSAAQEDYLKALYELAEEGEPVSTSALAGRLSISAPAATEMLGKLATLGLVLHDRYRGTTLTEAGRLVALETIRHHRLIESYLVRALGYSWDEVHEEADRLEHFISERLEGRIAEALGNPEVDPHGDPIPSLGGLVSERHLVRLRDLRAGETVVVRRVSDRNPDKLRALDELGLRPGSRLEVVADSLWDGPMEIRLDQRSSQLPLGLADAVFVEREPRPLGL